MSLEAAYARAPAQRVGWKGELRAVTLYAFSPASIILHEVVPPSRIERE